MNSLAITVSDYQEPSSTDLCQVDLYYALRHAREGVTLLPLSVIAEDPVQRTLDEFAREVLASAKVHDVQTPGEDMLPPYPGASYIGKLDVGDVSVDLKMLIVKFGTNSFASATMITGTTATAEETAVGGMVLKTVRVVR